MIRPRDIFQASEAAAAGIKAGQWFEAKVRTAVSMATFAAFLGVIAGLVHLIGHDAEFWCGRLTLPCDGHRLTIDDRHPASVGAADRQATRQSRGEAINAHSRAAGAAGFIRLFRQTRTDAVLRTTSGTASAIHSSGRRHCGGQSTTANPSRGDTLIMWPFSRRAAVATGAVDILNDTGLAEQVQQSPVSGAP